MDTEQGLENRNNSGNDRLIIIGSGSAAIHLYKIAVIFGYNITVMDRRVETITRKRFPQAMELLRGDVVQLLQDYDINESTSIILVNNNSELDEQILQVALRSPARYIGVLGSSRKIRAGLDMMKLMGTASELIERVHVPVGLGFGQGRDMDIALSALAEINSRFRRDVVDVLRLEQAESGEYN